MTGTAWPTADKLRQNGWLARPGGGDWQLFVYDEENCEVLYMAQHISYEAAKNAAVKFAMAQLYSTDHDLRQEVLSQMLVWEPI